ncbi:MAG TPA: DUF2239 family protein [Candidatus Sulfopaludibacter sp.]|jgi:hypothetical protein|nr:DUF2239 family protein [Candidatus Sulfopaludibacter sp.]
MNCTAFEGSRRIASGDLASVALQVKEVLDRGETAAVLVFEDDSGRVVDIDWRAPVEETPRRPGRPRLGVVAREVTLLPRHWEWLAGQPGGASVALRKLVEQASKSNQERDRIRVARESAYRFMMALAGNEAGFEEATRALFAGDPDKFEREVQGWPADVREHASKMAAATWPALRLER